MIVRLSRAAEMLCPVQAGNSCDGDRCMAWRWRFALTLSSFVAEDPAATEEPNRPQHIPASWAWSPYDEAEGEPASWTQPEAEAQEERLGYCGMAPRPEVL